MKTGDTERRLAALEKFQEQFIARCEKYRAELWRGNVNVRLEQAKQNVKVALMVGVLVLVGNAVITYLTVALLSR